MFAILSAALATFVTTAALTPVLAKWARQRNLLDVPNQRSSHVVATPRIGGAAIVIGVLVGIVALFVLSDGLHRGGLIVLGSATAISAVGLIDDFFQLSALSRLIAQILVAALVVAAAGSNASWLGAAASVAWIVAMTNAYNFMDGIDGIAGAEAVVAGVGWLMVGSLVGSADMSTVAILVVAAGAAFLLHNWHPATVFMGDAGSGFLGFLLAALPLVSSSADPSAAWGGVLLLWPFVFDTGFTLIRRASRGENVVRAHRSHLYQRLVQTGRSHRQVSLLYAGLSLLGVIGAISLVSARRDLLLGAGLLIVIAAAFLWRMVVVREATMRTARAVTR
jgi:UDP-N-acetylmuramyl pentapeptide phosphotransferase/UDP-N-acetylglucosamine-1-phosphate transferase